MEIGTDCKRKYFSNIKPANAGLEASDFIALKSTTGFECSMDGYTNLVIELVQVLILVISMYKEIIVSVVG